MKLRLLISSIVVGLILTGCSNSTGTPATSQTPTTAATTAVSTGVEVQVDVTSDMATEPVVTITPGDPAAELITKDVVVGEGAAVPAGATVTAHYVGYGAGTSQMFDSSWQRGEPATFPLSNVILGWQQGLVGMQVDGRRLLIIPAELGYGDSPPPGSGIEPGETLVFVVDLVSFQ
jgi:peptidylprolyl isomerase